MKQRLTLLTLIALLASACATVPKPQELIDLAAMRSGKRYEEAQMRQGELTVASDAAYKKAVSAWEDEELDLSKHYALLGKIKLRMAITLVKQAEARKGIKASQGQLAQLKARNGELIGKIAEADEQIKLHHQQIKLHAQLAAARQAAASKEAALKAKLTAQQKSQEQQKALAEAQKEIGQAQLALKMADTVDAANHAKAVYQSALTLLAKAQAALEGGRADEAEATARLALGKARAAHDAARPKYLAVKKSAAQQARNQALQKDVAGIAGVTVKFKTVGQTQQLIIPVLNLFKRRRREATKVRAEKIGILNAIGKLLKTYTEYPVIITGHTSYRVRRSQRYAVSQSRAQVVANHFVAMGIKLKRMVVAGRGAEFLVGSRRSRDNDRVEISLLFQ